MSLIVIKQEYLEEGKQSAARSLCDSHEEGAQETFREQGRKTHQCETGTCANGIVERDVVCVCTFQTVSEELVMYELFDRLHVSVGETIVSAES